MALCVRAALKREETLHPPQFPLVSTFHGYYAHVEIDQRRSELSRSFFFVGRATFHAFPLWSSDSDDFELLTTCLCVFLENDEFYVRLQSLLIGPVTNINRSILVLSRSKKKKQIPKVDQFNETFRFQATFFARIFFFFILPASITYL